MLNQTLIFIKELNRLLPITGRGAHAITLENNETLLVTLMLEDKWQSFKLDEDDLQKDPVVLAKNIYNLSLSMGMPPVILN